MVNGQLSMAPKPKLSLHERCRYDGPTVACCLPTGIPGARRQVSSSYASLFMRVHSTSLAST
eukprot:scaffold6772_cov32-Tisochrysis_lutea.AAC.1